MKSKIINLRLDQKILEEIELLCKREKIDRSNAIRKLLQQAIERSKLQYGINLYQERKASIEKAAEIAGVDLWSFHDEITRLGLVHPSGIKDLEQDITVIKKRKKEKTS